jgi:hypothetical protein
MQGVASVKDEFDRSAEAAAVAQVEINQLLLKGKELLRKYGI